MNARLQDRLFAACGIVSVVLVFAGTGIAMAGGKTHDLTVSSTTSDIADALAKPAGAAVWVGAYLELLAMGAFLAFAVWACGKLGGGLLGSIGRAAATSYTTLSVASLGVMDAIAYRAGKGMDVQLAGTFVTLNEALYVCTWFLAVFFLLAVAPLALAAGKRALGRSAIGIAALMLVTTAASFDGVGQFAFLLWLLWIAFASVSLARGRRAPAGVVATPQRA